jgi:hypothetical protein
VIDLANSSGRGWWAFDTLTTTVSEWWRKELLELNTGFRHWAERITGCRVESIKVRGARCNLVDTEIGMPAGHLSLRPVITWASPKGETEVPAATMPPPMPQPSSGSSTLPVHDMQRTDQCPREGAPMGSTLTDKR